MRRFTANSLLALMVAGAVVPVTAHLPLWARIAVIVPLMFSHELVLLAMRVQEDRVVREIERNRR